jgi:hypothetical protein
MRISVEDGAVLKGGIQVRSGEQKHSQSKTAETKQAASEPQKSLAATAGA